MEQEQQIAQNSNQLPPELIAGTITSAGTDEPESLRDSPKRRSLHAMFRPPLDLIFSGSFDSAKETGARINKWLLINIQHTDEFKCQVLNRDVWSNSMVREIVRENCVFWQANKYVGEGERYSQFYHVNTLPYIAILDPRTGEQLRVWSLTDPMTFMEKLTEFLTDHPCPDPSKPQLTLDDNPSPSSASSSSVTAATGGASSSSTSAPLGLSPFIDEPIDVESESLPRNGGSTANGFFNSRNAFNGEVSDDEAFRRALAESLKTTTTSSRSPPVMKPHSSAKTAAAAANKNGNDMDYDLKHDSDSDEVSITNSDYYKASDAMSSGGESSNNSNDSDVIKVGNKSRKLSPDHQRKASLPAAAVENWRDFLGPENDPKQSKLLVRYPDGKREEVTFPASSQLKVSLFYLISRACVISLHSFRPSYYT